MTTTNLWKRLKQLLPEAPLLIGTVTAVTMSEKAGMAVLILFFVTGYVLLSRVHVPARRGGG